jgi:hypothetical protein
VLAASIFEDIFRACLKKMSLYEEDTEYIVDEKLGTYFECLSVWDRKSWLAQEVHANQMLGISTMG